MNRQEIDTLIKKWEQQQGYPFDSKVKEILYCIVEPAKIQELFKNKEE